MLEFLTLILHAVCLLKQIRTGAFKAVDDGDSHALLELIQDYLSRQGKIEELSQPKSHESLLHRALSKQEVNMEIIRFLVQSSDDNLLCSCQQVIIIPSLVLL